MIRVGVVGYGLAGRVFHAPLIAAVEGLELAVVVTTDAARASHVRATYPGARVVAAVEDAWEHLDALVVAAPNSEHVPLALEAIARGLPVVVDKPLAPAAADAERVLDAGGRVTVFQNRRWDGDFLTVRRLVDDGRLGTIVGLESHFESFRPDVEPGWRESVRAGGGQLLDLGSHLVDQATQLFGAPSRVYAEVAARRPGAEVDDDMFIALEHEGGVRSHLRAGLVAPIAGPRFVLTGLGGAFACDGLDPQEAQLAAGLTPQAPGYGERPPGRLVAADGAAGELALERGRYTAFYDGVRAWLEDGAPPPVDPRDCLLGLRILDAARRSARTHEVVELGTLAEVV